MEFQEKGSVITVKKQLGGNFMKKKRIVSLFLTMLLVLASIMSPIALENQVKAATVVVKYGGKKHSFTAKKQTTSKVNGKKIKIFHLK